MRESRHTLRIAGAFLDTEPARFRDFTSCLVHGRQCYRDGSALETDPAELMGRRQDGPLAVDEAQDRSDWWGWIEAGAMPGRRVESVLRHLSQSKADPIDLLGLADTGIASNSTRPRVQSASSGHSCHRPPFGTRTPSRAARSLTQRSGKSERPSPPNTSHPSTQAARHSAVRPRARARSQAASSSSTGAVASRCVAIPSGPSHGSSRSTAWSGSTPRPNTIAKEASNRASAISGSMALQRSRSGHSGTVSSHS
jgi:hypothetical protein